MPEAAVNENYGAILREDDVSLSGQTPVVDPVAESEPPQSLPQQKLGLSGRGMYRCHIAMPLVGCEFVGHKTTTQKYYIMSDVENKSLNLSL